MLKKGIYFVSGIDTDAGKSYVTGVIARDLAQEGATVTTQKFIQTGGVGKRGVSIDIDIHRQIMGIELTVEDIDGTTAPVIFSYPASPHLSAKIDNTPIDYDAINHSTEILSAKNDYLLIEGAGGLHVPLEGFYTTIDFIEKSKYPLILATSGKLGSINHTLLSLEVCRNRGIEVAMVAYNRFFGNDKIIDDDTFEYICSYVKQYHPNTIIKCIECIEEVTL